MAPGTGIFSNLHPNFRGLAWPGNEYVLGTNKAHKNIIANLPAGTWSVIEYSIIDQTSLILSKTARGTFCFNSTNNRAAMFHFKKINGGRK
jgi:hypothetical protein